jgi:HPt (histidine-containing phosphotransfer) domain-containing protein
MDSKRLFDASLDDRGAEGEIEWAPPALLLEVAEGDDDLIREVTADFERDTENRLEKSRQALASGEMAKLRAEAHAIKGGARQVGAVAVADICQQIELSALQASPYELADRLTQLEVEFRRICAAMRAHLSR